MVMNCLGVLHAYYRVVASDRHAPILPPGKQMAQLPPIGLPWPLTKPPFGGCAIYLHYGVEGFPIEDGMATYQKIDSSTV